MSEKWRVAGDDGVRTLDAFFLDPDPVLFGVFPAVKSGLAVPAGLVFGCQDRCRLFRPKLDEIPSSPAA